MLKVCDLRCDALVDAVLLLSIQVVGLRDSEVRPNEGAKRVASLVYANTRMSGVSKNVHPLDDVLIS